MTINPNIYSVIEVCLNDKCIIFDLISNRLMHLTKQQCYVNIKKEHIEIDQFNSIFGDEVITDAHLQYNEKLVILICIFFNIDVTLLFSQVH